MLKIAPEPKWLEARAIDAQRHGLTDIDEVGML
jgi:hypothetical protein